MGPGSTPGVEWKIRDAGGGNHAHDSEDEALAELHEHGAGASIRRREVHRVTILLTRSLKGREQVHPAPAGTSAS